MLEQYTYESVFEEGQEGVDDTQEFNFLAALLDEVRAKLCGNFWHLSWAEPAVPVPLTALFRAAQA